MIIHDLTQNSKKTADTLSAFDGVQLPQEAIQALNALLDENKRLKEKLAHVEKLADIENKFISGNSRFIYYRIADVFSVGVRTWIDYQLLVKRTGFSKQTISTFFQCFHNLGLLTVENPMVEKDGKKNTRTYVTVNERFFNIDLWKKHERGHGGAYYVCKSCGSTHLRTEKEIIVTETRTCLDCGHVEEIEHPVITSKDRGVKRKMKTAIKTQIKLDRESKAQEKTHCEHKIENRLDLLYKPNKKIAGEKIAAATQPAFFCGGLTPALTSDDAELTAEELIVLFENDEPEDVEPIATPKRPKRTTAKSQIKSDIESEKCYEPASELTSEALELLESMLPDDIAFFMQSKGAKYLPENNRSADMDDAVAHYAGATTLSTSISTDPASTRVVIFDHDKDDGLDIFQDTARIAAEHGYKPLLEPSPAEHGGHLIFVFNAPVDARAVRQHLIELNPDFTQIKEVCPSKKYRIRWPGGFYRFDSVNEWCFLYNCEMVQLSHGYATGANVLASNQAPASVVPVFNEPAPKPCKKIKRAAVAPAIDAHHQQKYAGSDFLFQFNPENLIAYFNDTHSVEDILPLERNGLALAHWRGESTASVKLYPENNTWCDFGGSKDDGTHIGGDAFELYVIAHDITRCDALRTFGREFVALATSALKDAAKAGEPVPEWLSDYCQITQRGYDLYKTTVRFATAMRGARK